MSPVAKIASASQLEFHLGRVGGGGGGGGGGGEWESRIDINFHSFFMHFG